MSGASEAQDGLRGRPVVFGEILFDEFANGDLRLGGAPLNVAWHLQRFGLEPLLLSRVGADRLGNEALERMRAIGLDTTGVQIDRRRPTGRAVVSVRGGEPSFDLTRDQAYDFIDAAALPRLGPEHSLLYHGSLVARSPASAVALRAARASALPIFIDVNLRPPWWEPELVYELLSGARWIKANERELRALAAEEHEGHLLDRAESLRRRYEPHAVIATSGGEGALAVTADDAIAEPAAPLETVGDTVGAGDAFSAVAVLGVSSGWSLRTILQRAAAFAAAVCGIAGAVPADASFHRRFAEQWQRGEAERPAG